MNPIITMSVPVRYLKGINVLEKIEVEITKVHDNGTMTIRYISDMFGIGVHTYWYQLVSSDTYLRNI